MSARMRVVVIAPVATGKSHVMYSIEKALIAEYGETISIDSKTLESDVALIGNDINEWQRPTVSSIEIEEIVDRTNPTIVHATNDYQLEVELQNKNRILEAVFQEINEHLSLVEVHNLTQPTVTLVLVGEPSTLTMIELLVDSLVDKIALAQASFRIHDRALRGTFKATELRGTMLSLSTARLVGGFEVRSGQTTLAITMRYK